MQMKPSSATFLAIACALVVLGPVADALGGEGAVEAPFSIGGGSGGGSSDDEGGGGGEEPPCSPQVLCDTDASTGSGSLAAPPPLWYTQAIHEKVLAAGAVGLGYNVELDQFVPVNISFIRPGAWMVWPSWCTMGFVTGSPGSYSILTAGHCFEESDPGQEIGDTGVILDPDGEIRKVERELINPSTDKTVVLAAGSEKAPDVYVAISNTVTWDTSPDYALVSINATWEDNVDPTVEKIFGPDGGVYTGPDPSSDINRKAPEDSYVEGPLVVKFVGHGKGLGSGGTPRIGLVTNVDKGLAYCHCPTVLGDSGAPVLVVTPTDPFGKAYGIVRGGPTCPGERPSGVPTPWYGNGHDECASITLLSEIPASVLDQRMQNPRACQGEFQLALPTTPFPPIIEDQPRYVAVPYVLVYDDRDRDGRMDEGEQYQNKVSEAWWITEQTYSNPPGLGQSASSEQVDKPAKLQPCGHDLT